MAQITISKQSLSSPTIEQIFFFSKYFKKILFIKKQLFSSFQSVKRLCELFICAKYPRRSLSTRCLFCWISSRLEFKDRLYLLFFPSWSLSLRSSSFHGISFFELCAILLYFFLYVLNI